MDSTLTQMILNTISKDSGIPYNVNDPDYDYRGSIAAGEFPTPESGWHWLSQYKGVNHPNRFVTDGWGVIVDTISGERLN